MFRWTDSLILAVSALPLVSAGTVFSQEIGLIEEFALADDREAVLNQLVPGTENYYYLHALHYQTSGQLEKVEGLLEPWNKRFGETPQLQIIRNRQALLRFKDNPEQTYEFLHNRLQLHFTHQREIPSTERNLPTRLDPQLTATETLLQSAMQRYGDTSGVTDTGLESINLAALDSTRRRHLLSRLAYPDFPELVPAVVQDLREQDSGGFGSLGIHSALTIENLTACLKAMPNLIDDSNFVNTWLSKLHPGDDIDWRSDRSAHRAYLMRLYEFTSRLNPAFNSLKACVIFHRLELDRLEGQHDRSLFMEYLALPRETGYVNPRLVEEIKLRSHVVDMGADFDSSIRLAPIGGDELLVTDYLHHFLESATGFDAFRPWIRDDFLKRQFATVKILAGLGDAEQWASMLSPEDYQALLARVDLDFDPTNTEYIGDDEEVEIDLYTKNIDKLIVKIFEINTFNFYRKHGREIDTDINLDGLVPNDEQTVEYDDKPALRVKRTFKFDRLGGNGVYVIDFIGGGKSSRTLIRRGRLSAIETSTVAGQQFRVFDQNRKRVKDASLWIAGQNHLADDEGVITVPFSTQPGQAQAIISHGGFSSLQPFTRSAEQYSLDAGLVVDRESLLFNQTANLLIRPALKVAGVPASVKLLSDVQLAITSVDHSGIPSTKRIEKLVLADDKETVCEFIVPPRLKSIQFALSARVENISRNAEETLSVSRVFELNQIDAADEIQDLHLLPTGEGYVLETLGRTGERRKSQAVRLQLKHRDFTDLVYVDLQSDANGRIELGPLAEIESIEAILAGGSARSWPLNQETIAQSGKINVPLGEVVEIAAPDGMKDVSRRDVSLFEKRQGRIVIDQFDKITLSGGMLELRDLAPGDYVFRLKRNPRTVDISVVAGERQEDVVIGTHRRIELRDVRPLVIERVEVDRQRLRVKVRNGNSLTRVHVMASRYHPRFSSFAEFSVVRGIQPWLQTAAIQRSAYMAGRQLGDEYQYILNRRYSRRYPGNMLERPSLLVAPWSVRETDNQVETLTEGGDFDDAGVAQDEPAPRGTDPQQAQASNADFANLNFLGRPSIVLANLVPDKDGIAVVDRADLKGLHHVRIVAVDSDSTVQQTINLKPAELELRDLRLADGFDPAEHFSQTKQTGMLKAGEVLTIEDLVSGRFQYIDDIGDVFRLYLTLNPNTHLAEFEFLLNWSGKSDEEKRTLYSKYACHELNFYLFKKDRPFFDAVVKDHVGWKMEQGLIDRFLIDEDLEADAGPWQFARLNVFERILLAQRLEPRSADIVRNISDLYLLNPQKREYLDTLFETSIQSNALSLNESLERDKQVQPNDLPRTPEFLSGGEVPIHIAAGRQPNQGGQVNSSGRGGGGIDGFSESSISARQLKQSMIVESDLGALKLKGEKKEIEGLVEELRRKARLTSDFKADSSGRDADRSDDANEPFAPGVVSGVDVDDEEVRLGKTLLDLRDRSRVLYRRLQPTQEWVEQQYYRLPRESQNANLVTVNRFWLDYSKHRDGSFLSPHFAESHRSFTEMMFALAVIDLPEQAPEHKFEYAGNSLKFTAGGTLIALHQQFRPAVIERQNTSVLIAENFFQKNDRFRQEDGVQYDKFIVGPFHAHTLYGAQVVLTNPASTPLAIDLLVQIPEGSVAASGSQETRSQQIQLDAFSTRTFEYFFYFPTAGDFPHHPAHVSRDERVLAVAENVAFKVIDEPLVVDQSSWEYVSQNGSEDDVIAFLGRNNVLQYDLEKIAFRMPQKPFFQRVIDTLRDRCTYNHTLWSYGIRHQDETVSREYLRHEDRIAGQVGSSFNSPLLEIVPLDRNRYQHREYAPLINARIHQLGAKRKILNPEFHSQYHLLLDVLSNRSQLTSEDHLAVTYYMLLQDRIDEAIRHFGKVNREELDGQIQFDYCDACLDLYLEDPDSAAGKAEKWATYPVDLWRNRFNTILAQVAEIRGGKTTVVDDRDQTQKQTELAAGAPSFDFQIESDQVKLSAQNIDEVEVSFYEMDIELMFSRSPFAERNLDGFSIIRPNLSQTIKVATDVDGRGTAEFPIPEELASKNVLVEVKAGDQVQSRPWFANSMTVQTIEKYGQLKVADPKDQAIAKVYVKVYSQSNDGQVRFHKDGYTDLRGRFDYVSQSNNPLDNVQQYSVLILSPEHGAVMRQVAAPAE